ncbi:MAG: hypothetical protein V1743_07625 [Nanoarchaeota archaeon]
MEEKITAAQRFKLKHFVKQLEQFQGRHTELVSVYIPQDYDMNKIISHLSQEQGTASNIKSKQTRDNVIAALEKMIRHLKLFTRTPLHGLAAFAGNVAEREGQQDFQVWSIEPPIPLHQRLYRCDKEFILDPLQDMCEDKSVFGLVVMDKREGNVAVLKGKTIIPLSSATSAVPGKTRAGGQCLDPETEVILADGTRTPLMNIQMGDELKSYDFGIGQIVNSECIDMEEVEKKELLVIKTSHEEIQASLDHTFFVKQDDDFIEKKAAELKIGDVLCRFDPESNFEDVKEARIDSIEKKQGKYMLIDISVENQNFIANNLIVHNSAPRFERLRDGAAKEFMKKIADMMKEGFLENKDLKGIIVGGPGHTKNEFVDANYITDQVKRKIIAIKDLSYTGEFGLQELLDKSQDVLAEEEVMEEKKIMNRFLNILATKPGMAAYGKQDVLDRLKMSVVDTVLVSEVLSDEEVEEFEREAQKTGATIMVISTETREGAQLRDLGKVAAILRYEMHE